MKFKTFLCTVAAAISLGSCSYDDGDLWKAVNQQEERISALEKWQKTVNEKLASLQGIFTATDYVTGIEKVTKEDGTEGYKINFLHAQSITLYYNENNEVSGSNEHAIGVAQDENGKWYWTLAGEALVVDGKIAYVTSESDIKVEYNTDGTVTLKVGSDEIIIPEYPIVHPVESVEEIDGKVVVTLGDGTTVNLPKYAELGTYLQNEYTNLKGGEVTYTINHPEAYVIKMLDAEPIGWSISIVKAETGTLLKVVYPITGEATVTFLISDGMSQTVMKNVTFKAGAEEPWTTVTYVANTAITIPDGVTKVKVVGNASALGAAVFNTYITTPLRTTAGIAHIDLSEIVYSAAFPSNAFYMNAPATPELDKNESIETIILPAGIVNIWANAFKNCLALKSVTVNSATTIPSSFSNTWFVGCTALESIFVPASKIEEYKTSWDASLTSFIKVAE